MLCFTRFVELNLLRILPLRINQICQRRYLGAKCHPIFILYSDPQLGQTATLHQQRYKACDGQFRFLSLLYISAGFFLALYILPPLCVRRHFGPAVLLMDTRYLQRASDFSPGSTRGLQISGRPPAPQSNE